MEELKNRLKEIRDSAGLTILELSEVAGVGERTIQRHEAGGDIRHDILMRYANVFQLPMEFILGVKNDLTGNFDKELRLIDTELFKERFKAYNYEIVNENKKYYLNFERHDGETVIQDAHTIWRSSAEDGTYEIRVPRLLVKPNRELFELAYGKVMIINNVEEALALWCYGGVALIEKGLCEKYFSELFEPGIICYKEVI